MSIIGTIRNRFAWLIIFFIALSLLAFLIMDSTNSRGNVIFGAKQTVGSVEGKKVKAIEYQNKVEQLKETYPNATVEQIQNSAWNEVIDDKLFQPRYNQLGISVTEQELAELLKGENPHPSARQIFGRFSPDGQYDQFVAAKFTDNPDSVPNGRIIYNQLSHFIVNDVEMQEYNALLTNGVNTPSWLAKLEMVKEYKTVDFDYVSFPYSNIGEDQISVSDNDLLVYASKNKKKYQGQGGFILGYVNFPQNASKADTTEAMVKVEKLKPQFESAADPMQFEQNYSNMSVVNTVINPQLEYQKPSDLNFSEKINNQIQSATVGTIVGPFADKGAIFMVKVVDKKEIADSARVRHILITPDGDTPEAYNAAKELSDSLANELKKNKSNFDDYVLAYSADPGSKNNGGVYDYFPQGQMVPEFNDASFNGPLGDIQVVETSYGFHIVEVLGRKGQSMAEKLAVVARSVTPSQATLTETFQKAQKFEKESQTEESFEANAKQYGGVQSTGEVSLNANSIQGIGAAPDIMSWAMKASIGDTGYFPNINGQSYVIRLNEKSKPGEIDLGKYRAELTNLVTNEKKAEIIHKQIQENGGASQDLNALAKATNRSVQEATDAKFGASGNGIGYEPEVISALFTKPVGPLNEYIDGRRGVYVVVIKKFGDIPPEQNFDTYKNRINSRLTQRANVNAMRTNMESEGYIIDERYKTKY